VIDVATPTLTDAPVVPRVETRRTAAATVFTGTPFPGEPGFGAIGISLLAPDGAFGDRDVELYTTAVDALGNPIVSDDNHLGGTYVDESGLVVEPVPAGTYIVTVDLPGVPWGDLDEGLSDVTVVDGELTEVSIRLGAVALTATSVDSVVSDLWVYLNSQQINASGQPVIDREVDDEYMESTGRVVFTVTPGTYIVTANLDGWPWGDLVEEDGEAGVEVMPNEVTEVAVQLGRIDVVAPQETWVYVYLGEVDASGNPVPGVQVAEDYIDNTERTSFDLTPGRYVVEINERLQSVEILAGQISSVE
jgi:hypothetical protein